MKWLQNFLQEVPMERKTFWIAMVVAVLLSAVGGLALRMASGS